MIRLAIVLPSPNDVSSLFRGAGPFSILSRLNPDIQLVMKDAYGWADLCQCDAVFLQRPAATVHLHIAKLAKSLKLPIWVDYDDAVDLVPVSNPKWTPANSKMWRETMNGCLELASVVTVVNQEFAASVAKRTSGNVAVIPNAHNDYWFGMDSRPRTKSVLWRGGNSHDEDVMMVLPQLASVARDYPDWMFHLVGQPPWETRRLMPERNTKFHTEWKDYPDYMNDLFEMAPAIQVVPWCDNEFNRCKSNLAWLESTATGAALLAPAWADVFQLPGVTHYESDFGGSLRKMIEDVPSAAASRAHLIEHYTLSKVNQSRLDIIRGLQTQLTRVNF